MEMALGFLAAGLAVAVVALAAMLMRAREMAAGATGRLGDAESQAQAASVRLDAAIEARLAAERQLAGAEHRIAEAERRLSDFEHLRAESLQATKAALLETAQTLSSKLIDDHKRETIEQRKETEERVRVASELLVRQVDDIAKAVAELNGQMQEKSRVIDTVWRSLSSPSGAGQLAEIGLANTLKGCGLEAGRDFVLQVTTTDETTGQRLRPDALVFLPGDNAIVIDCKASKFLLAIAESEGSAGEAEAYANLARTMNQHLKDLGDRNYRGAVQTAWRDKRGGELGRVLSIMYLPNEGALEKLDRADPGFFAKARALQIIPAGPAGLHCALSLAATEIIKERQAENQQRIIDAAQSLLDGVAIAVGHAGAVGKALKTAAESFMKFSGSVNGRLLVRARRLAAMGVEPSRALPPNLGTYVVSSIEAEALIEADSTDIAEEPRPAPRLVGE